MPSVRLVSLETATKGQPAATSLQCQSHAEVILSSAANLFM